MISTSYIFGRKYGTNFLPNLVAYYPLNSNVNDLSGNLHNGLVGGAPSYVSGKVSNAIDFDNTATLKYFDIADNNDFSFTNGTTDVPFTISMWVNFSGFSVTGNWILNKRGATIGTDEWQFIYNSNRLSFSKFNYNTSGNQQISTTLNPFALNTWYHITYTDNGSGLVGSGKLYINGTLNVNINANSGTYVRMPNGTSIIRSGLSSWTPSVNFKHRGLIDELAIWKNRELTASEVLELYTKGNAGTPII